jgi:hypothetical protein
VNSSLFSQVNRVEFGPARTVPFVWLRVAMLTFSILSVFTFSVAAQVPPNGGLARYRNVANTVLERFQANLTKAGVRCDTQVYAATPQGFFNQGPGKTITLIGADELLASLGWLEAPPLLSCRKSIRLRDCQGRKNSNH